MAVIDFHTHVTPERFKAAIHDDGHWHGLLSGVGELQFSGFRAGPEERLLDMQRTGIDIQVLSPNAGFFQYDNDLETANLIAREVNDSIHDLVQRYPGKFVGMGTLPMQHIPSAIAEMNRVMSRLKFCGVEIGDHVNGRTYDDPTFRPFFETAEALGAIIFFHQSGPTIVSNRINRYQLPNSVGNLADRTITYASLVYGGVLDAFPRLKPMLAHAGGYVAFAIARMDKGSGFLEPDQIRMSLSPDFAGFVAPLDGPLGEHLRIEKAPSSYVGNFYYDCCTFTGPTLRFLIDTVGIDRIVLGTDYPAPMVLLDAVNWVNGLDVLTPFEKASILSSNASRLLEG